MPETPTNPAPVEPNPIIGGGHGPLSPQPNPATEPILPIEEAPEVDVD
jgi:hypothetical protein